MFSCLAGVGKIITQKRRFGLAQSNSSSALGIAGPQIPATDAVAGQAKATKFLGKNKQSFFSGNHLNRLKRVACLAFGKNIFSSKTAGLALTWLCLVEKVAERV
jgi:hypothetical protein